MPFEQVRDLIPKALDRSGDPANLVAAQVVVLWPGVVKKVMPAAAWSKSLAKKMSGGQLVVYVDGAAWCQEYKLRFPQLLKELNRRAKRNVVRQILFRVKY
ncbi:MAG TPA: DciA family protein [Patescibacteria group bacterium]|nr:DciA family protein [Patescibacteria group bacterium]